MVWFAGLRLALFRRALITGALALGLAGSTAGAATCPNDVHRTGASAALPDCRAYELVSPAVKASSVSVNSGRFQISEQEAPGLPRAVVYQSLGGFADPVGSGVAFDYLAQRTLENGTQGWSTHAITPPQDPLHFNFALNGYDPLYLSEATPDLTKMVHRTITPVTPAPNLPKLSKLYLRNDLRVPGAGSYQLLTDAFAPLVAPAIPTATQLMNHAGVSTDLHHILFETTWQLTADAPPGDDAKLYKSDDGIVRFVGILPADEGGGPAPVSMAGQSAGSYVKAGHTPNVLSDDGSRAFFTVPTLDFSGRLYMRDDLGTADTSDDYTVRIDRSERAVPGPERPATYWNAATDGSRVFFTSAAALTDDAPTTDVDKVYVYDASRPDTDADNLTYVSVDDEPGDALRAVIGVLDVSADGSTAYFIQRGQLVSGQPILDAGMGIYAWRDGEGVRFVGRMVDVADPDLTLPVKQGFDDQWATSVTPDGRHLLLGLRQPPWPGGFDHGDCPGSGTPIDGKIGCQELYLYDIETGDHPVCVSCDPGGSAPSGPAVFFSREGSGASAPNSHRPRPMTSDGSHVYFTTAERLLPTDVNEVADAYQYDVAAGRLNLISSGQGSEASYFIQASADGHDVFIASREQLSAWDTDREMDIYDARVDGGVAPPTRPVTCSGDSCQGDLAPAPPEQSAGSSALVEPERRGRVTRPRARRGRRRACRRGRVRRRVDGRLRCVSRARARRLAAERRARQHRGGGAR